MLWALWLVGSCARSIGYELVELSDSAVLRNLRCRYLAGEIYTFTGSILIAVNPFEPLPIYDGEAMDGRLPARTRRPSPSRTSLLRRRRRTAG